MSNTFEPYIRPTGLEEYAEKFADYFVFTRRDGILEARIHHNDKEAMWSPQTLHAWGQAWDVIGNDPENEVLILTGTGYQYLVIPEVPPAVEPDVAPPTIGFRNFEANFLLDIRIPTIGALNGPARAHVTAPLMCDITLCTEDTTIFDPHFAVGAVPGDGQGLVFEELIATKRFAYYMLTSELIDAATAQEIGLVNEVLPRESLLPRAWELAERIMRRPRAARLETHGLVSRALRRRLVRDFELHLLAERYAFMADRLYTPGGKPPTPIGPNGQQIPWEEWERLEGRPPAS